MKLYMKEVVAEAIADDLKKIHITIKKKSRWGGDDIKTMIDLATLTRQEVENLRDMLQLSKVRGTKVIAEDVVKYLKAADEGVGLMQARTVRQAAWMLEYYFAALPHHLVFGRDEYEGGSHVGYYVADVDYEPAKEGTSSRSRVPEQVEIDVVWIENEQRHKKTHHLLAEFTVSLTCKQMIDALGLEAETPALVEKLGRETVRYYETIGQIGAQHTARGIGLADLDDAIRGEKKHSWDKGIVRLDNFGVDCTVVVDMLNETDGEKGYSGRSGADFDLYRWHEWNLRFFTPSEDAMVRHLKAEERTADRPVVQVPVHPLVPVFDLRRHQRLRVHVNNLTPYEYRVGVAEGLVLPDVDRKMINVLVDQSQNTFQDIVLGKGQSMNIISSGPPGTGKTVTAEVFAEFKRRPLYNVQCSQLGLAPEHVEANLGVILQRANRWNAVLLLDEADVYIRKRSRDIRQNAIVGVFLRMLEYASCILFMTTNLPDDVDDAVASRCVVHLHYGTPTVADQVSIWRTLARLNEIDLAPGVVESFAEAHPNLTGRDVKNLLKLASFICESEKIPMGRQALDLALRFKPTLTSTAVALTEDQLV